MAKCYALLGWSLQVIESAKKLNKDYVVVSFKEFGQYADEHNIPFVAWDFNQDWKGLDTAKPLKELLDPFNADVAIPLFEETVEYAGALNSMYRDDPDIYHQCYFFRNKAIMKRRAYLGGLRVGLFEEVQSKEEVHKFYRHLNESQLHEKEGKEYWVHLKPFDQAGTVGHKLLRNEEDIENKVVEDDFPCMVESHLSGTEFSTEGFVHNGELIFLNITEYVHLGYSNIVPAGPELESKRDKIEARVKELIDAFGMNNGFLHAEWFINGNDKISFGEVAARIPGGHILELVSEAYDFDCFHAYILCHDPDVSNEELREIFPEKEMKPDKYSGCLMIYPEEGTISKLEIPDELINDPYFERHTLTELIWQQKVKEREGFGNHYGTVFFRGEDPDKMREILSSYEAVHYYV